MKRNIGRDAIMRQLAIAEIVIVELLVSTADVEQRRAHVRRLFRALRRLMCSAQEER
jgi:hypothetical protein